TSLCANVFHTGVITMKRTTLFASGLLILASAGVTTAPAQSQRTSDNGEISVQEIGRMYTLGKRWAELTANILQEFRTDGRDPTARLQGDFSTRTLKILTD